MSNDVEPATPSAAGRGRLRVSRVGQRSLVTRAYASSPLRLLTPRNHGTAAWVYTSTYGGGLVDGDAIEMDVEIGARATALIATQSATKVYRSPRGTSFDCRYAVESGALLVVAPDPVVPFAGSVYRQLQRFALAPGANVIAIDWFASGRHASGERWSFERYESRLQISRGGRLIMFDALVLDRQDGALARRMGRFDVLLTAAITGPDLDAAAADVVAAVDALPVERRPRLAISASRLEAGGCVLRIAGARAEDVWRSAAGYLRFVPAWLGDDPWRRKR